MSNGVVGDRKIEDLLLRVGYFLVPESSRKEWFDLWAGELWDCYQRTRRCPGKRQPTLYSGMIKDALWLRMESLRTMLKGSVLNCLARLIALWSASLLTGLVMEGNWRGFIQQLHHQSSVFLLVTPVLIFVCLALFPVPFIAEPEHDSNTPRWHLSLLFTAKALLVVTGDFLLAGDFCSILRERPHIPAAIFQGFLFIVGTLFGWRWLCDDQSSRCRICLRHLAPGRHCGHSSSMLLQPYANRAHCPRGHGHLETTGSETSWEYPFRWYGSQ